MSEGAPATEIEVICAVALHARPAARLVERARQHPGEVWIIKEAQRANAKSLIAVLALAAEKGARVTIGAAGEGVAGLLADLRAVAEGKTP